MHRPNTFPFGVIRAITRVAPICVALCLLVACSNTPPTLKDTTPDAPPITADRYRDYPYSLKLRPNLNVPRDQNSVYTRASGWKAESPIAVSLRKPNYREEEAFFNYLNIEFGEEYSARWEEIQLDIISATGGPPITTTNGSLEGSGFGMSFMPFMRVMKGKGQPTKVEWWEKGSVYPTWYPVERRTDPDSWQEIIQATDRRYFSNIETNTLHLGIRQAKQGEQVDRLKLYMPFAHLVGEDLRATRPLQDFGVEKLVTNTRRSAAGGAETTRPAIISNILIVLRSGWDEKDRALALRFITEFESVPDDPKAEIRHHWWGYKIFNEGPVIESLRKLSTHVDEKGVPGAADKESAAILDTIAESDGWSVAGPDRDPFAVPFKKNGEPNDLSADLSNRGGWIKQGWMTCRVPEKE